MSSFELRVFSAEVVIDFLLETPKSLDSVKHFEKPFYWVAYKSFFILFLVEKKWRIVEW